MTEWHEDSIVEYMRGRIEKATRRDRPFAYLRVTEFLPPDLYRAVVRNFPSSPSEGDANSVNLADPDHRAAMSPDNRKLWTSFVQTIYPKVMQRAESVMRDVCEDRIAELNDLGFFDADKLPRWGADGLLSGTTYGFQLLARTRQFVIPEHLHSPYELLSVLHYLPENDAHAAAGTELFDITDQFTVTFAPGGYPRVPATASKKAAFVPYLPNSAVIWVNTFRAIHSSPIIDNPPERRYIFAIRAFRNEVVAENALPFAVTVWPRNPRIHALKTMSARAIAKLTRAKPPTT